MAKAPRRGLPPNLIVSVQDVAERLREAHSDGRRCALLIGAGCSVSAGIPASVASVERIRRWRRALYDRACQRDGVDTDPSYAACMAELSEDERQRFITRYVDQAKINWAHIGIASLMAAGYVDRVLTTNFDPLVLRACALLNIYPSVHDLAVAGRDYDPGAISGPAVLHLHGQHSGFSRVMRRIQMDRDEYRDLIGRVIRDVNMDRRVWVVAGYSGREDPVFEALAKVDEFPRRLFWVGYRDDPPSEELTQKLIVPGKDAFFVSGTKAHPVATLRAGRDSAARTSTRVPEGRPAGSGSTFYAAAMDAQLPPDLTADTFFVELAKALAEFPPPIINRPFSFLEGVISRIGDYPPGRASPMPELRRWIADAVDAYERRESVEREQADLTAMVMRGEHEVVIERHDGADVASSSRTAAVLAAAYVARAHDAYDAADLASSSDALARADALLPDQPVTLMNWGVALGRMGQHAEAIEKYVLAHALWPDDPDVLVNWGATLGRMGRPAEAIDKFVQADALRPDHPGTLVNWGIALDRMDRHAEAVEKYAQAGALRPDDAGTLLPWGIALHGMDHHAEAIEKYVQADALRPGHPDTLASWGAALGAMDRHVEAIEKYAQANALRADHPATLTNWGASLTDSGRHDEAMRVLQQAEAIEPGSGAYNLACVYALTGADEACRAHLELAVEHATLAPQAHMEADHALDSVRDTDWFRDILEQAPTEDDDEDQGE